MKKTNLQSDPLWQLQSKIIVKDYYQLSRILNNNHYVNYNKYLKYRNFANNYYKPVNYSKIKILSIIEIIKKLK